MKSKASDNSKMIFNFAPESDIQRWTVINDIVMGGRSSGTFYLNSEGMGVFEGKVSLENNGGFSLLRYRPSKLCTKEFTHITIRLCGDGKKYQFRIKSDSDDDYSYVFYFVTSGGWQDVVIPLKEMYPSFRGKKLDRANFSGGYIEEIGFLIGNKEEETFKLLLDKIELN